MTSPPFQLDPRSATPLYDQLVTQVKHAAASGALARGDALPSVRALAVSLRINPNTVARAYRELEADGVVDTRRGQGTYLAEAQRLPAAARRRAALPVMESACAEANALGLELDEAVELLRATWRRMASGRAKVEAKP